MAALNKQAARRATARALSEYLDDVREIERRIQKAGTSIAHGRHRARRPRRHSGLIRRTPEADVRPPGAGLQGRNHPRIDPDVRARHQHGASYPDSGVRYGFHSTSHHSNVPANMDRFAQINSITRSMLAYLLEKLQATPDGDGYLLDHSMVLYGSAMSDGNQHDHDPLPIAPGRRRFGQLKGGRHLRFPEHTPMSNLLLAMLDKLGVQHGPLRRQHRKLRSTDVPMSHRPSACARWGRRFRLSRVIGRPVPDLRPCRPKLAFETTRPG